MFKIVTNYHWRVQQVGQQNAPGRVPTTAPRMMVRRQTLIAQVTELLRTEIASGRWPVGSRIPTEPVLSEMTGCARNTVREAVQALVHAGMLERRQGSGTYVIADTEQGAGLVEYFASARDRDLLELRDALESTAASLAAARRDDADITELRGLLLRWRELWHREPQTALERDQLIAADIALHAGIVAASHNQVYVEFYELLTPAVTRSISKYPVGAGHAFEHEHTELTEAVIAGDPQRASTAAHELMTRLRRRTDS